MRQHSPRTDTNLLYTSLQRRLDTPRAPHSTPVRLSHVHHRTPGEALDYGIIDEVIKTKTSHIPMPKMPSLKYN